MLDTMPPTISPQRCLRRDFAVRFDLLTKSVLRAGQRGAQSSAKFATRRFKDVWAVGVARRLSLLRRSGNRACRRASLAEERVLENPRRPGGPPHRHRCCPVFEPRLEWVRREFTLRFDLLHETRREDSTVGAANTCPPRLPVLREKET